MILLAGIPSESPLAMIREQLDALGAKTVMFNQRKFAEAHLAYDVTDGCVAGSLRLNGSSYRLEDFTGVLIRTMDDQALPELKDQAAGSPARMHSRALHEALMRWSELTPARIVNRI